MISMARSSRAVLSSRQFGFHFRREWAIPWNTGQIINFTMKRSRLWFLTKSYKRCDFCESQAERENSRWLVGSPSVLIGPCPQPHAVDPPRGRDERLLTKVKKKKKKLNATRSNPARAPTPKKAATPAPG